MLAAIVSIKYKLQVGSSFLVYLLHKIKRRSVVIIVVLGQMQLDVVIKHNK